MSTLLAQGLAMGRLFAYLQQTYHWALPNLGEVVNGEAIALSGTLLAMIPTEAADWNELRVRQEWIDFPSWAGDYYLAVQVNPDDRYRLGSPQ